MAKVVNSTNQYGTGSDGGNSSANPYGVVGPYCTYKIVKPTVHAYRYDYHYEVKLTVKSNMNYPATLTYTYTLVVDKVYSKPRLSTVKAGSKYSAGSYVVSAYSAGANPTEKNYFEVEGKYFPELFGRSPRENETVSSYILSC